MYFPVESHHVSNNDLCVWLQSSREARTLWKTQKALKRFLNNPKLQRHSNPPVLFTASPHPTQPPQPPQPQHQLPTTRSLVPPLSTCQPRGRMSTNQVVPLASTEVLNIPFSCAVPPKDKPTIPLQRRSRRIQMHQLAKSEELELMSLLNIKPTIQPQLQIISPTSTSTSSTMTEEYFPSSVRRRRQHRSPLSPSKQPVSPVKPQTPIQSQSQYSPNPTNNRQIPIFLHDPISPLVSQPRSENQDTKETHHRVLFCPRM